MQKYYASDDNDGAEAEAIKVDDIGARERDI